MPAKWFQCPDGETIPISKCFENKGCRMDERCATRPFLRLVGYDRKFKGVTPSSAGNGPRLIYLKIVCKYIVDPQQRVWAAFGTSAHEKLSIHSYNILSEESLSDEQIRGIPDCLEQDEENPDYYILIDYKTWGSYKVAKALGIYSEDEPVLDNNGYPLLLKSGKNKGQLKMRKVSKQDTSKADLRTEELQINRYRILFENYGFPISKMQIQTVSRDGGTYVSRNRGVEKNMYVIPIKALPDTEVLGFYVNLICEVDQAFKTGYVRQCNNWESWDGRRCERFCEVSEQCKKMGD